MTSRAWIVGVVLATVFAIGIAAVFASDSSTVAIGQNTNITAFSTCKKVTNNSPTGLSVYVPTVSSAEWSSFYGSPPPGVLIDNCGSSTVTNPTRNGLYLHPSPVTAARYCMEQGFDAGVRLAFDGVFSGSQSTTRYINGSWSAGATGPYITNLYCFNTTSKTDVANPTNSSKPVYSDEFYAFQVVALNTNVPMSASRYCESVGYPLGVVIDEQSVPSTAMRTYVGDAWANITATSKITSVRCFSVSGYTDIVNPSKGGYRLCRTDGVSDNFEFSAHQYCTEQGYSTGLPISTDPATAPCSGGSSQCTPHWCSYYGSGSWHTPPNGIPPNGNRMTQTDVLRCFNI